ncbi:MAG: peptidoglycan editing factor PgeF, partial [Candidatus Marinimicrobia bacterium]|nr:peptidoglycan editing factor PgeF [Candidatus Neomarinimicrobiota bacterium]
GFNSDSLIIPKQTHSTNILFPMEAGRILDTDGVFSSDPNLVCSIQVADCIPVYFVHQLDSVFGLVHAGWRGLVNGILLQSAKQIEENGKSLSNFDILIGPSIQKCCFEVSDDVINKFDPNFIEEKGAGKYRIDLQKLALHQLVQNGFKSEKITTLTECTYCEAEKYHSYRRNGKKAGRMIGLLGYC